MFALRATLSEPTEGPRERRGVCVAQASRPPVIISSVVCAQKIDPQNPATLSLRITTDLVSTVSTISTRFRS